MVSKMGRNFVLFVVLSASLLSAQTPETMTNEMVFKMVQAGVPTSVILQTIAAAPRVDFSFLPRDLQAFAFYKVWTTFLRQWQLKTRVCLLPALLPVRSRPPRSSRPQLRLLFKRQGIPDPHAKPIVRMHSSIRGRGCGT